MQAENTAEAFAAKHAKTMQLPGITQKKEHKFYTPTETMRANPTKQKSTPAKETQAPANPAKQTSTPAEETQAPANLAKQTSTPTEETQAPAKPGKPAKGPAAVSREPCVSAQEQVALAEKANPRCKAAAGNGRGKGRGRGRGKGRGRGRGKKACAEEEEEEEEEASETEEDEASEDADQLPPLRRVRSKTSDPAWEGEGKGTKRKPKAAPKPAAKAKLASRAIPESEAPEESHSEVEEDPGLTEAKQPKAAAKAKPTKTTAKKKPAAAKAAAKKAAAAKPKTAKPKSNQDDVEATTTPNKSRKRPATAHESEDDPKAALKAKNARKSKAYCRARTEALNGGATMEEAKEAAKEAISLHCDVYLAHLRMVCLQAYRCLVGWLFGPSEAYRNAE